MGTKTHIFKATDDVCTFQLNEELLEHTFQFLISFTDVN